MEVDVTVGNQQKLVWEQGKKRQKRLRNRQKLENLAKQTDRESPFPRVKATDVELTMGRKQRPNGQLTSTERNGAGVKEIG